MSSRNPSLDRDQLKKPVADATGFLFVIKC